MSDFDGLVVPAYLIDGFLSALAPHGWDNLTDEEKAQLTAARATKAERAKIRRREMWVAMQQLPSPLRELVDLHKPVNGWRVENQPDPADAVCDGCDMSGYEAESPEWPCRTAVQVAELGGIDTSETSRW